VGWSLWKLCNERQYEVPPTLRILQELTIMAVVDTAWPPKSPHAALLSSPSGRRKFQEYQGCRNRSLSPTKRSTTLPNVHQASRRLLDDDEDNNAVDDLEDDEETLQLKLAAIEAKLKLKKLQQDREKLKSQNSGKDVFVNGRPQSSSSRLLTARPSQSIERYGDSAIEIPVSPTRKPIPQAEQRSPGRILLGIDKGVKATEISLGRARGVRSTGNTSTTRSRLIRPDSADGSQSGHRALPPVKTFSERMAESRAQEEANEKRKEATANRRSTGFKLNQAEMEGFQKAAAEARTHNPPRSPTKARVPATFSRDAVLRTQNERPASSSRVLKKSSTLPNLRERSMQSRPMPDEGPRSHTFASQDDKVPSDNEPANGGHHGDPALYDPYSQLQLSSRVLPHSYLQRTLPSDGFAVVRLPQLLKQVKAPAYELPGLESKDVVIVGVIASKSSPIDHKTGQRPNDQGSHDWEKKWDDGSQNQKRFMVLQISDLTWSVDLYLFGTAVPRYHRLSPGTVVAVLNPGIMPPKKGKEDTGAFSLTLHQGDDTVLEIGTARDLGFCNAVKKDGKECGSWVNLTKTEVCEFHLNMQITKTQSGRMGVNTGSNKFARGADAARLKNRFIANGMEGRPRNGTNPGLLPKFEGRRYDRESESHYFMVESSDSQKKANCVKKGETFERSAAGLLDLDDDDPFIAEGRLSRDREARLKNRLLKEEKERDIALKLTALGSGGAGGAYLRHRMTPSNETSSPSTSAVIETGTRRSAMATKDSIMRAGTNTNGKRAADSVRLSPMKKTRFLTDKGIREAGRESLGGQKIDQDDDLDIV
jgi:minichromosome maintenance protein 10